MTRRRRPAAAAPRAAARSGDIAPSPNAPPDRARIDKWLWRARFYKTRALAAEAVQAGRVRVNAVRVTKPGHGLKTGDVLTFVKAAQAFVIEITALGDRRGPSAEAKTLYRDISNAGPSGESAQAATADGRPEDTREGAERAPPPAGS